MKRLMKDMDEDLCAYCPLPSEARGVYSTPGGYSAGCEGCRCQEAYESYLESDDDIDELVTKRMFRGSDDWVNDLTKEMDKHLVNGWKKVLRQGYLQGSYIYHPEHRKDGMALRFPGATRGHLCIDERKVITDIVFYDTAIDEKSGRCYKISVKEAVKKFIGMKIVLDEKEPENYG